MTKRRANQSRLLTVALLGTAFMGCQGSISGPGTPRDGDSGGAANEAGPGWVCSPATCPDGCCRDNKCLTGTTAEACGSSGSSCMSCAGQSTCSANRVCTCDATTCSGCCSPQGCLSGVESTACGKNGEACQVCGPDDQCTDGSCAGPCFGCTTGCCAAGSCRPGTEDAACGKNGEACQSCGVGTTCDAATGTCVPKPCDPSWCKGCCDATVPVSRCVDPPTSSACGLNGAACKDCGAGMFCDVNTGNCSSVPPTCDASNCSGGCCTTSKQCITPPTSAACGMNGAPCQPCAASQSCSVATGTCACNDSCAAAGARQCAGNGYQTCVKDSAGCLSWSAAVPCAGSQVCSGGQCVCQNTCSSPGARECVSQYLYRVCTADAYGCLTWVQDICQSGYKCQGTGQCVCENYCTPGVTQCADRFSFTKCEDLNGDGCTDKPTAAKQCKNEDPPFFRCINTSSSSVICVCADENCINGSNYSVTGWVPGGSSAKDVCYYCSYSAAKCTRGTVVTNSKWCTGAGSDPTTPYCNIVGGSPVCQKTSIH